MLQYFLNLANIPMAMIITYLILEILDHFSQNILVQEQVIFANQCEWEWSTFLFLAS